MSDILVNDLKNEIKKLTEEKAYLLQLLKQAKTAVALGDIYPFDKSLELAKKIQDILNDQET